MRKNDDRPHSPPHQTGQLRRRAARKTIGRWRCVVLVAGAFVPLIVGCNGRAADFRVKATRLSLEGYIRGADAPERRLAATSVLRSTWWRRISGL